MLKKSFRNYRDISVNTETVKLPLTIKRNHKDIVDINKLLNRVKLDNKNEKKKKIALFFFGTLLLTVVGFLLSIIR
jgi:hypothetical protein|tara:strand:+ start:717 stop:944 length:228 start_codon:yes stop_codon:yes gene_type:complete